MKRKKLKAMIGILFTLLVVLATGQAARAEDLEVTNTNNFGYGSLRQAINDANSNDESDTISFDIPGAGLHTIHLTSALPELTEDGTTIDGYTQTGAAEATSSSSAVLRIEIEGSGLGGIAHGLGIASSGNTIKGLVINRFSGNGIAISSLGGSDPSGNVISGNYIGVDASGLSDQGNGYNGIFVGGGAHDNTVGGDEPAERNIISGNEWEGVGIHGEGTVGNVVSGNYIGLSADGSSYRRNTLDGVRIYGGAQDNTIGGNTYGELNTISGNGRDGVRIVDEGTKENRVQGNYIGTNKLGTIGRANAGNGVYISNQAKGNTIGGDAIAGERNLISSNDYGVVISGTNTMGNIIAGNLIGTNSDGTLNLGNQLSGVLISNGATNNTVGGDTGARGNVISGNGLDGVLIYASGTMSNTIIGNYIGTNHDGSAALSNGEDGISISGGAQNNTIGGETEGARNIISGNDLNGVRIVANTATGNRVLGNYIGTDSDGTTPVPNGENGVHLDNAPGNTVGPDNLISGNDQDGVLIEGSHANNNTVSGNQIGTDASGMSAVANIRGVHIVGRAHDNVIGGDTEAERNVISGNGVGIWFAEQATANTVTGNYIGVAANGTEALKNDTDGIDLGADTKDNVIGPDNVISANGWSGVLIGLGDTTGNTVAGNHIGTDASRTLDLGNGHHGVYMGFGTRDNTIGPDNAIAYNSLDGVHANGATTIDNTITQNNIWANGDLGIELTGGSHGDIQPPVIVTTTLGSVNVAGTACSGCTVELFVNSDTDGEGETYTGQTTATATGAFTVTVRRLSAPYLTVTATDATSGTSQFSEVFTATVLGHYGIFVPIVFKDY